MTRRHSTIMEVSPIIFADYVLKNEYLHNFYGIVFAKCLLIIFSL